MNVLLLALWDTKPDKRIRRTFPTPDRRRSTSSYAAIRAHRRMADESGVAEGLLPYRRPPDWEHNQAVVTFRARRAAAAGRARESAPRPPAPLLVGWDSGRHRVWLPRGALIHAHLGRAVDLWSGTRRRVCVRSGSDVRLAGLYQVLRAHRRTVTLDLGLMANIAAGVTVTLMLFLAAWPQTLVRAAVWERIARLIRACAARRIRGRERDSTGPGRCLGPLPWSGHSPLGLEHVAPPTIRTPAGRLRQRDRGRTGRCESGRVPRAAGTGGVD